MQIATLALANENADIEPEVGAVVGALVVGAFVGPLVGASVTATVDNSEFIVVVSAKVSLNDAVEFMPLITNFDVLLPPSDLVHPMTFW